MGRSTFKIESRISNDLKVRPNRINYSKSLDLDRSISMDEKFVVAKTGKMLPKQLWKWSDPLVKTGGQIYNDPKD